MKNHRGVRKVEPIRDLDKIKKIKDYLLHQSYRNYFLFVFGINSGSRISDMLPLRVRDVRKYPHMSVHEQQTWLNRQITISPTLRSEIDKYTKGKKEPDFLFPSRIGDKSISRMQAWQIIHDAAKACAVEGAIGNHTLRKTFGYHFYQRTKDIALLQGIFNHSSPSFTLRYIGFTDTMMDNTSISNFSL